MDKVKYLSLKHKVLNKMQKYLPFIDSDKMIYDFIRSEFREINEKYSSISDIRSEKPLTQEQKIWLFWWQGYDNAPLIVKKCIQSVKENSNGHEVVLLTKENWKDYAELPDYIIIKMSQKKISLTHFSDILRMELLSRHGGVWLDATIFVRAPIPDNYFSMRYFTVHYRNSSSRITRGKWTGFCQGSTQNQIIQNYCHDIFHSYWQSYNSLIDYFLIDYVMRYGYDTIPQFRTLVDSVPENNAGIKELDAHFNDEYSKESMNAIMEKSIFFKLNWKRKYALQTADGKETIYARFMQSALTSDETDSV